MPIGFGWNKLVGFGSVLGLSVACWLSSTNPTHGQEFGSQQFSSQASRIATSANAIQGDQAALAKQQYEAALRAQMMRAQREQAASPEFAEQAFQATKAYLDDTAEKSYRPGISNAQQTSSYQASATQAASFQATTRSANTPSAYASAPTRKPVARSGYQQRPAMPPVHVSPGPHSTPPPATRSMPSNASRQIQAAPRGLQDRLANLVRRKKQPMTDTTGTPQVAPTLAAPRSSRPEADSNRNRYAASQLDQPNTQSTKQPLFVPEPRRLPKSNRMAAGQNQTVLAPPADPYRLERQPQRNNAAPSKRQEVMQVALNRPAPKEPRLVEPVSTANGPTANGQRPQDYFDAVQVKRRNNSIAAPTQVPTKLASVSPSGPPSMQGASGSYQTPNRQVPAKTVSVLAGKSDSLTPPRSSMPARSTTPAGNRGFSDASYTRPVSRPTYDGGTLDSGFPTLQESNQTPTSPMPDPNAFGGTPSSAAEPATSNNDPRIRSLNPLRQEQEGGAATQQEESAFDRQLREMEQRRQEGGGVEDDVDKLLAGMDDEKVQEPTQAPKKTCQEFRTQLLGSSIRDIALDMSPPASRIRDQFVAISRSWTDRLGNVVATGTMVDLRRGYVIIDGSSGRVKIPYAKLSDADWAAVSEYWQIPELCSVGASVAPTRAWVPQTTTWHASALCHKPLYFENRQLERYGHTHGPILQPIHSTAHFFVSLATLPYQTAIHPPTECMYALGFYRPGNCAPWLKDPVPISLDGIRRQALVTTGLGVIP